jgi:hypothetical protein
MKRLTLTSGLAAAIAFVAATAAVAPARPANPSAGPRVTVSPAVVARGHTAVITVSGVRAPSLQARAAGASANLGQRLPWTALHLRRGVWRGVLPAPEFRGVYPLELRVRAGAPVLRSEGWLLRVLARGTLTWPSFSTPEAVASWWVTTLPFTANVVAMKRWQPPDYDLRDRRLHQLIVVAYSPVDRPAEIDRLGMFVTAVRDSVRQPWRMLEATVAP